MSKSSPPSEPPSDRPQEQHDPAEVIEVASELMDADREKEARVDLRAIGEEVGVPAAYVDKAVAELDRRREKKEAARTTLFVRGVLALLGVVSIGGVVWLARRPSKTVDASTASHPSSARVPASASSASASASATAAPIVKKPFPPTPVVKGAVVAFDLARGDGWGSAATALEAQGATIREIDRPLSDATLSGVDALVLIYARRKPFAPDEVLAVERFVRGGKGLVVADIGWTWIHYDKKPITTFPINAVGEKLGFRFTGDNIGTPARIDDKTIGTVDDLPYDGWAPTRLELEGDRARALVRDDALHPMAAAIDVDRGHVVVFGHPSMILLSPPLFRWSLAHVLPTPSSCGSPEKCQDERCRGDIGIARIAAQIELVLGVTPSCAVVGAPYLLSPGPNHYYGATLRCTLATQPKPAQVKTFTADMNAAGFPAYQTRSESGNVVVTGATTTRALQYVLSTSGGAGTVVASSIVGAEPPSRSEPNAASPSHHAARRGDVRSLHSNPLAVGDVRTGAGSACAGAASPARHRRVCSEAERRRARLARRADRALPGSAARAGAGSIDVPARGRPAPAVARAARGSQGQGAHRCRREAGLGSERARARGSS